MKKILVLLLSVFCLSANLLAQTNLDDFGRIVLNTYLPEAMSLPTEAKNLLETKLNQITTSNGIGGSQVNPRFIITASVNVGTKDVIAGPPQLIAQNLEITLFIGDAISNTKFSNVTIPLKGVGTNENKALIEAFKTLSPKNKAVAAFLEEGKNKIISYYTSQCNFINKDVDALAALEKYDEAIYKLSIIPEVSKDCYFNSLDRIKIIYQQKIDADGKAKLLQAQTIWLTTKNTIGAEEAAGILSKINPMTSVKSEADAMIKMMESQLNAAAKVEWQMKVQESSIQYDLEKSRITAYREIALEYLRKQPKTVTYNNIYWR